MIYLASFIVPFIILFITKSLLIFGMITVLSSVVGFASSRGLEDKTKRRFWAVVFVLMMLVGVIFTIPELSVYIFISLGGSVDFRLVIAILLLVPVGIMLVLPNNIHSSSLKKSLIALLWVAYSVIIGTIIFLHLSPGLRFLV